MESVDPYLSPEYGDEPKHVDNERAARLKAAMLQFVLTMKNLALYPPTNKTNIEAIGSLYLWLSEYLSANGSLVLEVNKDQLLTDDGAVVYQEKPNDQILAGPMFRDGIQAISFEIGLTEDELRKFLLILLRFRNVETDEEDLVANLWEASLAHVRYVISSEYEQVDPEFELSAMKVAKPGHDIDAPYNNNALAPMASESGAPISKNISSLFALAESTSFFGSTANGFGQGAVSKSADTGFQQGQKVGDATTAGGEVAYSGVDFANDKESQSDTGESDSSGFDPLDSRHSDSFGGSFTDQDGSMSRLSGSRPKQSDSPDTMAGGAVTEEGGGDNEELDIDMSSVAEAFKDMSD
ncbi:MAG: hypothetical protein LBU69_04580, partial [Deltaproteobacteria bacterium]|nr:hypothetical protein [Deltaproteobacteria bacterium]